MLDLIVLDCSHHCILTVKAGGQGSDVAIVVIVDTECPLWAKLGQVMRLIQLLNADLTIGHPKHDALTRLTVIRKTWTVITRSPLTKLMIVRKGLFLCFFFWHTIFIPFREI